MRATSRGEGAVDGVSVLVCTRNGAARLPATLSCLAAQEDPGVPWEVVLVDNGSADGTAEAALRYWPAAHPAPLRVVREETPGIGAARKASFREARYGVLVLVDDDNHLPPGFLARAARTMEESGAVALAGGPSRLVHEGAPPPWFHDFSGCFAVGSKWEERRIVTREHSPLWGAGMVIRRALFDEAARLGWTARVPSRSPGALGGLEDVEYCYLALLSGWDILYDPALGIGHAVDPERLSWAHLRRQESDSGEAGVAIDPYRFACRHPGSRSRLRGSWLYQFLLAARKAANPALLVPALAALATGREGERAVIRLDRCLGRLRGLWKQRRTYREGVESVRGARWCRPPGERERAGGGERGEAVRRGVA